MSDEVYIQNKLREVSQKVELQDHLNKELSLKVDALQRSVDEYIDRIDELKSFLKCEDYKMAIDINRQEMDDVFKKEVFTIVDGWKECMMDRCIKIFKAAFLGYTEKINKTIEDRLEEFHKELTTTTLSLCAMKIVLMNNKIISDKEYNKK